MFIKNLFKFISPRCRLLWKANRIAKQIDLLKPVYRKMTNEELSNQTNIFLDQLKKGKTLDDILPNAFAVVREAIYRVHGLFAFHVQIVGAIIANHGDFAEMYTGEGKTLTVVIVAYLNALLKKGVHIVTVNEYLVKRDAQFCAQCLNPLGITVGYNLTSMDQNEKRKMFSFDITYTTNAELGFDYLRDNMVTDYNQKVLRELNYAIIDEADSILIDESRTPLIISGQPKHDRFFYISIDKCVKTLNKEDYMIDHESQTISLTESGVDKVQKNLKIKKLYVFENSELIHKIKNALIANYLFEYGVQYIVKDNKIQLVDHFTGRILEGRSYNAGLQQAIQAKENVPIDPENNIVATITYQSFFRLYHKLSGFSGTALTAAEELLNNYNMVVVPIPTNKKIIRKDLNDYIFETKVAKWAHVVSTIEQLHTKGQPILIGTGSVEDSEELALLLKNKGLKFELLNARNNFAEAKIIAQAGQKYAITISTNMAGRGTDIKLGEGVKELGGLFVVGTNKNESRRIDNQLRGRAGRQGDPGTTRFFISLEDPLFLRFLGDKAKKATSKIQNDKYFDSFFFNKIINAIQKKIEGLSYDMRKNLIDYDTVLSNQRELIYKQRDQILLNFNNMEIIDKMIEVVANNLVKNFTSIENNLFIDGEKLAHAINTTILFLNIFEKGDFYKYDKEKAVEKIKLILKLSILCKFSDLDQKHINIAVKNIMIENIDSQWINHLDQMAKIREGVALRSLEQKSPLNIYTEEADNLFNLMKEKVAQKIIIDIHHRYNPEGIKIFFDKLFENKIISSERKENLLKNYLITNKTINIDFTNFFKIKKSV